MYVVIVGAGSVGSYLTRMLTKEGHDVAVIEADEKVASRLAEEVDALIVRGNGASKQALDAASVERADLFITVTDQDETNMLACLAAKNLPRKRKEPLQTLARVHDQKYLGEDYNVSPRNLGIDDFITAEHAVAEHIGRLFRHPGLSAFERLADNRLAVIETRVERDFEGTTLSAMRPPRPGNLIAVQRGDRFHIPSGSSQLRRGDRVFCLTVPGLVEDFLRFFGHAPAATHHILIIGGGRIGYHVARYLEEEGHGVTLCESDPERAQWVAARLSRSTVLEVDATNALAVRQLVREGADVVAVLIKQEEKSLLIGMYAKHVGAQQVITRVDDFDYAPVAYQAGIDSLLSPQRALAQSILNRIRQGRMFMFGDDAFEILDFTIPRGGKKGLTGRPIEEVRFPDGSLLGGIVRGPKIIIPRGEDHIEANDHVIVSVLPEAVRDVEELFADA